MTSLIEIDLDQEVEQQSRMSTSELMDLLEEISKRADEPEAQLTIMKVISLSNISLEQVQRTQAEKFFRKLAARPIKTYSVKSEEVKVKARSLIKQWGAQRSEKKVVDIDEILKKADEKLNSG